MVKRVLVAFDFDHTLIDGNSDTYVLRLLPDGGRLPASIQNMYTDDGWNDYQREVFRYLHSHHITKEQLMACVTEIPVVEGMRELLEYLVTSKMTAARADAEVGTSVPETEERAVINVDDTAVSSICQQNSVIDSARTVPLGVLDGFSRSAAGPRSHSVVDGKSPSDCSVEFDAIIISDANSVLIDHILETAGLQHVFSKVYTNPALFDSSGCLQLSAYQHQDWCSMSQPNICKGHVLDEHRQKSGVTYDIVAYVGDGRNDFCPTVRLRETDIVFPRQRFSLEKCIAKSRDKVAAMVKPWNTGLDIMNALKEVLRNDKE